ncbi:MAG: hypothetical protein E6Q99_08505 [Elusimicrobia bacterium]|nr:MAG: hypothetical protein E6Q99_08505 [Elusimicrobiota bacterium]
MKPFFPRLTCLIFAMTAPLAAADSLYLELSARGEKIDLGLSVVGADRGVAEAPALAAEIARTLKSDLAVTGLFTLIEGGPVYDGRGGQAALGGPRFMAALHETNTGRAVVTKTYALGEGARRAAHLWADEIVRYFTGQAGSAASRVVFVNDATGKKEVCVIDADGEGFRRLTNDRSIALFPKLSPDGSQILFTSFRDGAPAIHVMNADGTSRRVLCRYPGLNAAAAWTPDGRSIVATLSLDREPNLHVVDLQGRVLQDLTRSAAADTAPTVSPDGLRVAFTSDRPGTPQIYTVDMTGANIRRVVTGGLCDSPQWSPLGHLVAFTMLEKRYFDLWTLEVATGKTARLTFGEGDNENAAWSPDGRRLAFTTTRRGKPELWTMGADGSNPRPLAALPGRSFTPHWGR